MLGVLPNLMQEGLFSSPNLLLQSFVGAGQMGSYANGSDGFNRILTRLYFFSPVGVRLVPLKTHDFKDFDRILTGF